MGVNGPESFSVPFLTSLLLANGTFADKSLPGTENSAMKYLKARLPFLPIFIK